MRDPLSCLRLAKDFCPETQKHIASMRLYWKILIYLLSKTAATRLASYLCLHLVRGGTTMPGPPLWVAMDMNVDMDMDVEAVR